MNLRPVLAELGRLTPYFRLTIEEPPHGARPVSALLGDSDVLHAVVDQVAVRLHTKERRVAASTLLFGYAARVWSLALGTHHLTGQCLDLNPDGMWWRSGSGTVDLGCSEPRLGGDLVTEVLDRQLGPLISLAAPMVSTGLMWGNAAAALLGAARVIPDAEPTAREVMNDPRLAGRLMSPDDRRRSCCLYYRTQNGGYCGDCALTAPRRPLTEPRRI